jgi:peptidoglycan/LPS O-acetylase OafA/YrhL
MRKSRARGRRVELSYHAGLDGLRALAVIAVVLYHGGVSWDGGGFLGVEMFFVLSGFLITTLLVSEWLQSGTIALRAFWARRARRLLPALFCLVAAIGVYYAIAGTSSAIPGLKGDGIATLLYFGNWHQIASGSSYFAATGPVSPLTHTWSLAIEEQFYILWPVLLMGILWLARRLTARRSELSERRTLQVLLSVSVAGAVASWVEMALLYDGGQGLNRVYYGTDTRAAGLLAGASLAIALAIRRRGRPGARGAAPLGLALGAGMGATRARALGLAAAVALAGVLLSMGIVSGNTAWVYPFGLAGLDLAMVVIIGAAVLCPASVVARALSWRPLRGIGKISYGLYLWHYPLFLWLDTTSTGKSGDALLALRLAVTLAVSIVSFVLIEQPIRQRKLPTWLVRSLAPLAAGGAVASLLVASTASALPLSAPPASILPRTATSLKGTDAACQVSLTDTRDYGLAPPPASKAASFEYTALGKHELTWSGSAVTTFNTCPPNKVLLIGDSLSFTLGVGMLGTENQYGIELADAGILGCAFTSEGDLNVSGVWQAQSAGCPDALETWAKDEKALDAKAVVVELGYRDQFDWRINGHDEHLGDAAYDTYVQRQIDQYVKVLGRGGTKILFLSVPWSKPPADPNGSPSPAASPARHTEINRLLQNAASLDPSNVQVLDIDNTVSPGNHYDAKVNGQLCRFDGIHFTLYCSELLEPSVLGTVDKMIG